MKHGTRDGRKRVRDSGAAGLSWGVAGLGLFLSLVGSLADATQEPPAPRFVVYTIDGPLPAAPLEKLHEDWSLGLGGGTPRSLAGSEWVSLRRDGVSLPPFPSKNCARLTSGDYVLLEPGAPFRLEEERLFFRPRQGAEIGVPLAYVSYLCWRSPSGVDDLALFLERLGKSQRLRDVIHLASGDSIEGSLAAPARGPTYSMKVGDRSVEMALDQMAVLAVNTELQARPRTKKPFAHVVTTGGARLRFASLRLDAKRNVVTGRTLFGANWEVALDQVAVLAIYQGQAVYLSDLTPKSYEFTPFFGVKWPLLSDRAVTGGQLSVGEDYYDKGLGMHAQSRVTYALGGNYAWFEALVGLCPGTGTEGHVKIRLALDGKTVISGKELSGRQPVLPVRLDVRKARDMTLQVEFGNFGDAQGRVNWADARLIRQGDGR